MPDVRQLSLHQFGVAAIVLAVSGLLAPRIVRRPRVRAVAPYAQEAGVVIGLYVLWQLILDQLVTSVSGAVSRGQWIWDFERTLHLPSEAAVQRLVVPHPLVAQASNGYYSGIHFPAMIGCLVWVFAWHRERYSWLRLNLIVSTGICAVIQAIPVAPPRLISGLRMIDTGIRYHQSDYGPNGLHDPGQVISMPSVHVAWAVLVAVAVILISRSRWRWWVLVHPVLTMLVVVDTANHFWLDGIVAAAIVGVSIAFVAAVRLAVRRPAPVITVSPAPEWSVLSTAEADAGP